MAVGQQTQRSDLATDCNSYRRFCPRRHAYLRAGSFASDFVAAALRRAPLTLTPRLTLNSPL